MADFTVHIELRNVAAGDVEAFAQDIWDRNADDLDAPLGDFEIRITRDGFAHDWEPDLAD
jgi:hypothetical protein